MLSLLFYDDYKEKANDYLALNDYLSDDYKCMTIICAFNFCVRLKRLDYCLVRQNGKYGEIVKGEYINKSLLV